MTARFRLKSGFLLAAACLAIAFTIGCGQTGTPVSNGAASLTVTLTGQSMLRSDVRVTDPPAAAAIASLLKGDVKFTNFEATVAEPGQPNAAAPTQAANGGGALSPPEALDALQAMGFNLVDFSNNHAFDLRLAGLQNTLAQGNKINLVHAGTGNTLDEAVAPGYLRTPNGTVALVAMASGLIANGASAAPNRPGVDELRVVTDSNGITPNEDDAKRILQSISDASKKADLVVVYQHNHVYDKPFGTIFSEELPDRMVPPAWIKQWTHREVDAGADIVVLHGSPVIQGVEIYHNKVILYDLGNFIFNFPPTGGLDEPIIWESVVAYVEFQGKQLKSVSFQPIALNKIGQGQPEVHDASVVNQFLVTHGLPAPAKGDQANYILQRLVDLSRPFGTTMKVTGQTAEVDLTETGGMLNRIKRLISPSQ